MSLESGRSTTPRDSPAAADLSSLPEAGDEPPIGLALSGGGVRAALFSLGVVIGLIESGYHRRLRCVTSVSGGSIVNAVLAHGPSLNSISGLEQFEKLASAIAASLARRGVFAFDLRTLVAFLRYTGAVILRAIPPVLGALIGLSSAVEDINPGQLFANLRVGELLSLVPVWWLVGVAVASLTAVVLWSRGLAQQARYESVLGAIDGEMESNRGTLYVQDWTGGTDDATDSVMHVLVATDLNSGEPMYFSKRFIYCRPYGWSPPGNLKTAEALYSSAAFPAVFPPKKLRLKNRFLKNRFSFTAGAMAGELPRCVHLADGGVYNNLGDDWFSVLRSQESDKAPVLWPFGRLKVHPPMIAQKNIIVVNASAPSQKIDRIVPLTTVARIMSVLYDNTVRPRVERLLREERPVIDISESPLDLAVRLQESKGEVGHRAGAAAAKLRGMGNRFWYDLTLDTSGTPTKLTRAGTRTGARLMLHGYLSTLVLLHAQFGVAFPEEPRGDDYFLSLVSGTLKAHEAAPALRSEEAAAG